MKPLNVNKAGGNPDAIKAAEAALTAARPPERKQDVRMSTMTESEVMAKLREVVSKDDPNRLYAKQKKIGQGASGSVYVAKVIGTKPGMPPVQLAKSRGNSDRVAIKQMDLAHQPRKELIVNEILVMRDNRHPNIVNFLDAFLMDNERELWVVMEYMEGGALTDIIENNPVITEEQISTICLEVCTYFLLIYVGCSLTLQQTCQGLEHLHSQNIIHRDIKSDNVLLDARGNVKISMFSFTLSTVCLGSMFGRLLILPLQPTLASAPSSLKPSPSVPPWSVRLTGWLPKLSSRRSMARRWIFGRWVSWLLR